MTAPVTYAKTMYRVFVTHGSPDRWVASQIAREVSACGAIPFFSGDDLHYGEDIDRTLKAALRQSNELVALLTPTSISRSWIWSEIGAAWIMEVHLVGVLYGITRDDLEQRNQLTVLSATNLVQVNDLETYFDQLRSRVGSAHE